MLFNYFGSPSKFVHKLPAPAFRTIVDVGAGSCAYSCLYKDHDVICVEPNPIICEIIRRVQRMTRQDVRELPEPQIGKSLKDYDHIDPVLLNLLGFCVGDGNVAPHWKVTNWEGSRGRYKRLKNNLLEVVGKISHWQVFCGSYSELADREATWFVHLPSQLHGDKYPYGSSLIDYDDAGQWCLSRSGQIIALERGVKEERPSWLPYWKWMSSPFRTPHQPRNMWEWMYSRGNKLEGFEAERYNANHHRRHSYI